MPAHLTYDVSKFLDHLKFEKRYSAHTVRSYHDDLLQFSDYLDQQFGGMAIKEISSAIVRSWLASLKQDKMSARSITRKISTLKSFFRFMLKSGAVVKSPMVTITSPKVSKKLPFYVEEGDMKVLFRDVAFTDDWNGYTGRLAMLMLYLLGIRLSELVNCKERQVDYANNAVKVLGKGNKERVIPVGKELLAALKEYVAQKKVVFEAPDRDFLLVTDKGKKLYPKYVYRLTQRYLQEVTTIEKKSPHVLRHSFATHLSNNGAELNAVKELLGHASLAATQVYTHNTIEKLKNVHRKAHPRG
jgi:integrase/recombinase XerC